MRKNPFKRKPKPSTELPYKPNEKHTPYKGWSEKKESWIENILLILLMIGIMGFTYLMIDVISTTYINELKINHHDTRLELNRNYTSNHIGIANDWFEHFTNKTKSNLNYSSTVVGVFNEIHHGMWDRLKVLERGN